MDPASAIGIAIVTLAAPAAAMIVPGIVRTTFLIAYRSRQKRKRRNAVSRQQAEREMPTQRLAAAQARQ